MIEMKEMELPDCYSFEGGEMRGSGGNVRPLRQPQPVCTRKGHK